MRFVKIDIHSAVCREGERQQSAVFGDGTGKCRRVKRKNAVFGDGTGKCGVSKLINDKVWCVEKR